MANYTDALGIELLEARQTQPHLIVNSGFLFFDKALGGRAALDFSTLTSPYDMTNTESTFTMINTYGALANFTVRTNGVQKYYIVINDSAYICTFSGPSGVSVNVAPYEKLFCYYDGTNMHAIAKSENTIDSGWTNATLNAAWSNSGGFLSTAQFRKIGKNVRLKGHVNSTTANTNSQIFTLPAGYRPSEDNSYVASSSTTSMYKVNVYGNGIVEVIGAPATLNELSLDGISFFIN